MVNLCEDCRLDKLCVNKRRDDRHDRLIRVHDRPLGHRINVAREAEVLEIREKVLRENGLLAEILDILLGKPHIFHILNDLLEPCKNSKAAFIGICAVKDIECGLHILVMVLEITVRHRQLVKVNHHRDIAFVKLGHVATTF